MQPFIARDLKDHATFYCVIALELEKNLALCVKIPSGFFTTKTLGEINFQRFVVNQEQFILDRQAQFFNSNSMQIDFNQQVLASMKSKSPGINPVPGGGESGPSAIEAISAEEVKAFLAYKDKTPPADLRREEYLVAATNISHSKLQYIEQNCEALKRQFQLL